ncbi:MAG: FtsX-like permease family protein, partial [Ruminococcaceae bacterium]|nr:FtsX-like permease family protein [Oscillospiraceae bacterium]
KNLEDGKKALDDARSQLDSAQEELNSIEAPQLYVLARNTNVGYVSFENDTAIVLAISTVFPVFFFLVAALVCNTTMSRMVNEERGKIGTLKALGFATKEIRLIYILYAGSSSLLGCFFGFFVGSYAIPTIIWEVYKILYGFAPLNVLFSVPLLLISLVVSLVCSVGVTLVSCNKMLKETPASLIRPRDLLGGNRSLLERIPLLKNCLGFFGKISIRNTFKYKSRLVMMILGIAGCTALLITGFGIDDSISGIVDEQFNKIMSYDYILSLKNPIDDEEAEEFKDDSSFEIKNMLFLYEETLTIEKNGVTKQINLNVPSSDNISDFIFLKDNEREIPIPQKGEAVISRAIADAFGIKVGDTVNLTSSSMKQFNFKIADICDNHVSNYIYVSKATYSAQNAGVCLYNRICANVKEDSDLHAVAAESASHENVIALGINSDTRKSLDDMLSCLNLIVYLVCICAGALAFIVIYNLTNLNISERIREIATLKVLGFKKSESALYVFRETAIQSMAGILFGIPLGILLHSFVMAQIKIDFVSFDTVIHTSSFIISAILTVVFLVFVDIILYRKIEKINPAEALKSVE